MTTTTQKTKSKATTQKPILDLPANPFIFEILQVIDKERSNSRKVEALKKYRDPSLVSTLIWNFDESVISMLPDGDVPYGGVEEQNSFSGTLSSKIDDAVYKMNELGSNSLGSQDQGRSSIRKEYKKFYNFIKGGNDSLSSIRRETLFINLLQGLHPREADIIILVKDKKLQTRYKITKEVVAEAYPDIHWGGRS